MLNRLYSINVKLKIITMNFEQLDFVTYCIGNLAERLRVSQQEVYNRLKSSGILYDYIVKGYDVLHTFSKEYLMSDLLSYMQEKGVRI